MLGRINFSQILVSDFECYESISTGTNPVHPVIRKRTGVLRFFETPAGYFYGFPQVDDRGVKVADHTGGTEIGDPLNDEKSTEVEDVKRVEKFLAEHLPGVSNTAYQHAVCYYTMSPDEHFIVDRHPEYASVVFAAGLSGHGFKFTSVLGEILAELVVNESTRMPIEFLGCQRRSLLRRRV